MTEREISVRLFCKKTHFSHRHIRDASELELVAKKDDMKL